MFSKVDAAKKNDFLDKTKAAREERSSEKFREKSAVRIQSLVRGYLTRQKLKKQYWADIDDLLKIPEDIDTEYKPSFRPAIEVFVIIRRFLFIFDHETDQQRFEYLCKYLLGSMSAESMRNVYVSVALSKDHVLPWIQQLKSTLWQCCLYLKKLKPEASKDMKMITTLLHMLITFTSTSSWKLFKGKTGEALKPGMNQLCNNVMGYLNVRGIYPCLQVLLTRGLGRSKSAFKPASLAAIITISLRPLVAANFSDNLMTVFMLNILAVPAVIYHVSNNAQECLAVLMTHRIFKKSLDLLCHEQSTKIVFNVLEGNYALCLLANLIQLGNSEMEGLVQDTHAFMFVVTRLLQSCKKYVQSKRSNLTHWHPVLGWFSQKTDQNLHEAMPCVVQQLQLLWSMKMIKLLFEQLFTYHSLNAANENSKSHSSPSKNIFKKAMEKASTKQTPKVKVDSPVLHATCQACGLYLTAIKTLTQLKLDILAGLCCRDILLPKLWRLIMDLGPNSGLKAFTDILSERPNDTSHVLFYLLTLSCDTASHIITILDDMEFYEQSKPFSTENLVAISAFLNYFIFRTIWNGNLDVKTAANNEVFQSTHFLLMILYERDSRRSFTPKDHWLVKDVKSSTFIAELERGKKAAQLLLQKVPHIIPHKERVILFRKNVAKEKEVLGLTESACASPQSTLITVHRSRIIEDGYRQLAELPSNALKGVIRVKFINEQGLDEAGIDQDGVFKEFLEETIARVFDPSLNLFKVTDEQKLYPSTTSYITENHLALFTFVGKMLAKAVYEGIVVDVPFAPFFLSQLQGQQHSSTYSSIDELPSMDPDLFKSLAYVKHYDGDIADLDLTFSYDEDVMGKLITHELVPGGKAITVTNENKISYVHLMAHFKMKVQIREQTIAMIHGFKSIINTDWLTMFSAPELQKLVSGDTADIDFEDLRRHTQYYGGFHNSHRVVNWLWDILTNDFNPVERGQFLKDTGDTVGSVLKGFFNIRKKDPVGRLPTSSTCFNLLKLPNYQKKSTLREKLRYAITSNTGFELS